MDSASRHQCLIYEGSPSRNLPGLAEVARQKLKQNFRCLYLDSPPMVAGMRCYLAAAGIDVTHEVGKASLVLSSDQSHLVDGHFDVDRMMQTLQVALEQALSDGYDGLWATGDMSWEFGARNDFARLLEYEWRLEEFFRTHSAISGICQYHKDALPLEAVRHGLVSHGSIFINETLSRINPQYVHGKSPDLAGLNIPELDELVSDLCNSQDAERHSVEAALPTSGRVDS